MASATVATPSVVTPSANLVAASTSATVATAQNEDTSPEGRFTAAMIHIVSLSENEPPKGRKACLAWQEQVEEAYSEGVQALFGCLPDGIGIKREVLVKILSLGLGCVRGGMIFQQIDAPLITS